MKKNIVMLLAGFAIGTVLMAYASAADTSHIRRERWENGARTIAGKIRDGTATNAEKERLLILLTKISVGDAEDAL